MGNGEWIMVNQIMVSQDMRSDRSFLGTGWAFPPTFNRQTRQVEMVSAETDILQSIEIILSTQLGERLMRTDFGCDLSQFLFEELRQGLIARIQDLISDSLLYYEPRITVNNVHTDVSQSTIGLLLINIDYTVRQTNSRSNLVYPFYIHEATYP
jgi:phage baseplate assembly protein W